MERELFSVEESAHGWIIRSQGRPEAGPDSTQAAAFRHAQRLAHARFVDTGHPTGVTARFHDGDAVLLAVHG